MIILYGTYLFLVEYTLLQGNHNPTYPNEPKHSKLLSFTHSIDSSVEERRKLWNNPPKNPPCLFSKVVCLWYVHMNISQCDVVRTRCTFTTNSFSFCLNIIILDSTASTQIGLRCTHRLGSTRTGQELPYLAALQGNRK